MVTLTQSQLVAVAAVMALWLVAAAWAVVTGLLLRRRAGDALLLAGRFEALASLTPAIGIMIRRDGRIEGRQRNADWLGLPELPRTLDGLAGSERGLDVGDLTTLTDNVQALRATGRPFEQLVRPLGGRRALLLSGTPATPDLPRGAVLVWMIDASQAVEEADRLRDETDRAVSAFGSLSQLIEAAPVPMWYRGPDLRLSLVNRAYVEAVDATSAEDAVARGVELIEEGGGAGSIAAAAAARDSGQPQSRTVPATVAGQRRFMRIVEVPLGSVGVAGYALDTDDLERARTAYRRFVAAQRDTLDRLSAGVAQFAADRSLAFSNQAFQRIFALKPEWVADRPEFDRVLDRMREAGRIPEARDFTGWKTERRRWFQSAQEPAEETWLLPGGLHLRVVAQPLPDGGLLVIFEDRTEQVQLASARDTLLRVREATFDNLFEAVGVFGADGRLNLWNNRFRDVWTLDEELLRSRPRVDALAEAAAPRLASPQRAGLMRDLVRAATVERQGRSGRIALKDGRHFEFAGVPLPDGNALFALLDITDSRRIERVLRERAEALEATSKVKTEFVANMSYELRTPLTSIAGFAEMLAAGYAGALAPSARDYVEAILAAVAKLNLQVDEVLQMAQSDAGLTADERERVELQPIVSAIARHWSVRARERGQGLETDLALELGRASIVPAGLRQMLERLLAAASANAGEGGTIKLRASGDERHVRLSVSDDGAGAVPDLAMADGVVAAAEAQGGTASFNAQPGSGTTVTLTFPR